MIKPGFHKANFDHDNDQFWVKTKRFVGRMTAEPLNRFFWYPGCEVCWKWNPGLKEKKLLQTICKTEGFEASFDSQQSERSGKIIEISFVSTQSRKHHHPFKAWFPLDSKYHDNDKKQSDYHPV